MAVGYRPGDASLLCAHPYWRVTRSALVIGIEPCRDITKPLHVLYRFDAAQIARIYRVRRLFLGDPIPKLPYVGHAVHIDLVVLAVNRAANIRRLRRCPSGLFLVDFLAIRAMADFESVRARPSICVKALGCVALIQLPINSRHLLGKISAKQTGLIKPWALGMPPWRSISIQLKPLRMGIECFFIGIIAIHSGNNPNFPLACSCHSLPEQISRSKERTAMMKWNLCRIKRHDAAAIGHQGLHLQRRKIVRPGLHIHGQWILFVEVQMPASEQGGIPWLALTALFCSELSRRSNNCRCR